MKNLVVPTKQQINTLLGHYQNGRHEKAEKLAKRLAKSFPKHQFSWKVLGALYEHLGRRPEAISANQKAIALSPNDADAHNNLGNTLLALSRLDEAEESFKKAIALRPNFSEAYNNLGNTLKNKGVLDKAEANLRKAIALNSKSARAHNNLGVTLKEMGRLDEAEASYKKAIALRPNYSNAHRNLGHVLKELKKYEEAIFHFNLVKDATSTSLLLECLYMNKNQSLFDSRLKSMVGKDDMNIRVAAVSAFVAHQTKQNDPYRFCPNPLDFILIENLDKYESDSAYLINSIIKEADGFNLVWESRTTKFGFQGPNDLFQIFS